MELEGNCNARTSVVLLRQLRERHPCRLNVIWDNAPVHRGNAVREYLRRTGLELRLVNLSGCSPDFSADEAICRWVRVDTTGNLCLVTQGLGVADGWPPPRWAGQPQK